MRLALFLLTLLFAVARPAAAQKNLVVIVSDQFAYWASDPDQRAPLEMPVLDALAERGTRFTRCYATSPVCSANRLALLSGQYPFVLGTNKLDPSTPSLGVILERVGYDTGYIGKWHLSPDGGGLTGFVDPQDRPGWRYFAGNEGAPHNHTSGVSFKQNSQVPISTARWEPSWQTNEAVRFLRTPRSKPFALVLNYGPPHPTSVNGYMPPQAYYTPGEITPRPNVDPAKWPEAQQRIADYLSLAVTVDIELGVLLPEIDLDETFVVFTSDHGDMLYSQGSPQNSQKRRPWEESAHVPLIVAGPGLDQEEDDRLITTVDILPSALSLLGLAAPDFVAGRAFPEETPAYFGHDERAKSWQGEPWRSVVRGRIKYAVTESLGDELLYDLGSDPFEQDNLALDPAYSVQLARMRRLVRERAAEIGDPFFASADGPERAGRTGRPELIGPLGP